MVESWVLQGRITEWLQSSLGWASGSMLPSVRCGLEGALLSALADARRLPLHTLLAGCPVPSAGSPSGTAVNALLHCQGTPEERAGEAKHLVSQGYKTLKIKVKMRNVLLCCIEGDRLLLSDESLNFPLEVLCLPAAVQLF